MCKLQSHASGACLNDLLGRPLPLLVRDLASPNRRIVISGLSLITSYWGQACNFQFSKVDYERANCILHA